MAAHDDVDAAIAAITPVPAAPVDGAANVASSRTLGDGALQAVAGARGRVIKARSPKTLSRWYPPTLAIGDWTQVALTLGQLLATWVWVEDAITIDALDIYVATAAGAGGVVRLGVWDITDQSSPFAYGVASFATLLADSGDIVTTSIGRKIATLGTPLVVTGPRWIAVGSVAAVAAPQCLLNGKAGVSAFSPLGMIASSASVVNGNAANACYKSGVAAGALPATLGAMTDTYLDGGVGYRRSA